MATITSAVIEDLIVTQLEELAPFSKSVSISVVCLICFMTNMKYIAIGAAVSLYQVFLRREGFM